MPAQQDTPMEEGGCQATSGCHNMLSCAFALETTINGISDQAIAMGKQDTIHQVDHYQFHGTDNGVQFKHAAAKQTEVTD